MHDTNKNNTEIAMLNDLMHHHHPNHHHHHHHHRKKNKNQLNPPPSSQSPSPLPLSLPYTDENLDINDRDDDAEKSANMNMINNNNNNTQRKREKQKRTRKLIIKLISESFTNSLTQAIIKLLATPHTILKMYLFVNVCAAIGIASYMVLQSIMSYLSYEVITTSRTVYEKPTTFPKILICNQNMFQTEYAYDFINDVSKSQMNISFDDIMKMGNFSQKWDIINRLNFVVNSIANDRQAFSNENRRKLAHDLRDVLVYCSFGPDPCGPEDFAWSFDPVHGNCYRQVLRIILIFLDKILFFIFFLLSSFNSGINSNGEHVELKKATLAGSNYGFKIMMYVNVYQKLTLFNANWGSMGAILRITNNSYLSDTPDGIKVNLQRKIIKKFRKMFSQSIRALVVYFLNLAIYLSI